MGYEDATYISPLLIINYWTSKRINTVERSRGLDLVHHKQLNKSTGSTLSSFSFLTRKQHIQLCN